MIEEGLNVVLPVTEWYDIEREMTIVDHPVFKILTESFRPTQGRLE